MDVFAPGVLIESVGFQSDTGTAFMSGTSMASPHVAGLAAYLITLEGLNTPAAVTARIKSLASGTGARASGVQSGTTTIIAYNGDGF